MIIDSHTHILPPDIIKRKEYYLQKDSTFSDLFASKNSAMSTADTLITKMDQYDISSSVVLGMGWQDSGMNSYVNDYLLDSAKEYPNRLYPFTGINPSSGKSGVQEAERCANAGAYGFGEVHPSFQNIDLSDKTLMEQYMHILESKNLPITIHCSEPVGHSYPGKGNVPLKTIESFIFNFPENKIILAHWGGGLAFFELMPEVSATFENVYYDSAASPFLYNSSVLSLVTKIVSARKLLFGSDYPVISQAKVIGELENSSLTSSEKKSFFNDNIKKLISRNL